MDLKKDKAEIQLSSTTLRQPAQLVKKRSGPLVDAIDELHQDTNHEKSLTPAAPVQRTTPAVLITEPITSAGQEPSLEASLKLSTFSVIATTPQPTRRRLTIKEREKKCERWLLTRKTWKYMTDAGHKLIPDGAQNRREDVPNVEAHFQQICANEPRFILWRRKFSYPGAMRNSKGRLKNLLHHTVQKSQLTVDVLEYEAANNVDQCIDLLQSYLKLDEVCKTTALLSSQTVRPGQTARRPDDSGKISSSSMISRGAGFLVPQISKGNQQLNEIDLLLERLEQLSDNTAINTFSIPSENITPAILENKVLLKQIYSSLRKQQLHRVLSKHSTSPLKSQGTKLNYSSSLSSLVNFSGSKCNIAPEFHENGKSSDSPAEAFNRDHTSLSPQSFKLFSMTSSMPKSPTLPSLVATGTIPKKAQHGAAKDATGIHQIPPTHTPRQRKPLDIPVSCTDTTSGSSSSRTKPRLIKKYFNSCGTQTSFVSLQEIKRLAEKYNELRKEQTVLRNSLSQTSGSTDDEAENTPAASKPHHRRKSLIDNEDISQSVSDAIKRYLRMARKKTAHDDSANRFRRVNYDRNLRYLRANSEINPPGMDEDNSKAVQTLDAWPLISLDFIRGNKISDVLEKAHAEWQRALDKRMEKNFENKHTLSQHADKACIGMEAGCLPITTLTSLVSSCGSSSVPTSPSSPEKFSSNGQSHGFGGSVVGLRFAGSQFLSNLWYGTSGGSTTTHHDEVSVSTDFGRGKSQSHHSSAFVKLHRNSKNNQSPEQRDFISKDGKLSQEMQKFKSSSNVGQLVSRKILKTSSKSQPRSTTAASLSKWEPAAKFTWTSDGGDRLLIQDSNLQNLTEIEVKILQRVAIEKISELNIGVNVYLDNYDKPHKRRILAKKKAITTSFFDIIRKEEQGGGHGLFGNSLESCLANDMKRCVNIKAQSERGSRNSLAALFRSGGSDSAIRLHENMRSYESLPSSTFSLAAPQGDNNCSVSAPASSTKSSSGYFGSFPKSTSTHMQISRSQTDVRRHSHEFDAQYQPYLKAQTGITNNILKVPSFVTSCIKYLEEHGLYKVGLFRVSTSKKRVKQMREEFDKNCATDIDPETSPHDVATLLKEFLRDLPEPLLCSGLYKAFLETQRLRNRRLQLEAISHLIKLLPTAHRDTLYVLLKFLAKVASCSDDVMSHDGNVQIRGNKMDSNNLATIFAPNILRTLLKNSSHNTSANVAAGGDSNKQESICDAINVIRIMIDHCDEIFKVPADLIDIVYSHLLETCPETLYHICEHRSQIFRENISNSCSSLSNAYQNAYHGMQKFSLCNVPSGVVMSSNSMSSTKSKCLYTRESVMHENDASRMPEAAMYGSSNSKRHASTHASRLNSMTHMIRQNFDCISNGANSDLVDRRKSSPNIFDKCGIVSASLQIPVPSVASHFMLTPGTSLQRSPSATYLDDFDEVFYKNEAPSSTLKSTVTKATTGQKVESSNQYLPVSGSLSFCTKIEESTKEIPQFQIEYQQTKQNPINGNTAPERLNSSTQSTMTVIPYCCSTDIDDSSIDDESIYDSLERKAKAGNTESKLSVGISNIGGTILRSKTADSERMALGKQKQRQSQLQTMQRSSTISVAGVMPSSTTITSLTTMPHLYKRQELIQSAKRVSTNNRFAK